MSFNGNNVLLIFVSCTSCFIVGSKCASLFPTVPQILREKVFPASFIFKKKQQLTSLCILPQCGNPVHSHASALFSKSFSLELN